MTKEPPKEPEARHACPRCGGASVPIVYGMPGIELAEQAQRGEIELGGCCIWDGQPTRRCTACEHAWRPGRSSARPRPERPPRS